MGKYNPAGGEGPGIPGPPKPWIDVPGDLPSGFWEKAMRLEFMYALAGLIVVLICILGGIVLFLLGVTGSMSWTLEMLGAKSNLLDAAPGAVLFVVGLFLARVTRFDVKVSKRLGRGIEEVGVADLRRGVVKDQTRGTRFYIDDTGGRHLIPDEETARFLRGPKDEIEVSTEDLEDYPLVQPMDSVFACDILKQKTGPHIFAVLNGKRYHVGMDDLFGWGRHHEQDWRKVDEAEIRKYPRGR